MIGSISCRSLQVGSSLYAIVKLLSDSAPSGRNEIVTVPASGSTARSISRSEGTGGTWSQGVATGDDGSLGEMLGLAVGADGLEVGRGSDPVSSAPPQLVSASTAAAAVRLSPRGFEFMATPI